MDAFVKKCVSVVLITVGNIVDVVGTRVVYVASSEVGDIFGNMFLFINCMFDVGTCAIGGFVGNSLSDVGNSFFSVITGI